MKCTNSYLLWLLCLIPSSQAFSPIQLHNRASLSKLNFGLDPSVFHFHDLSNPIASSWSTFQVAVDAATDIASNIPSDGVVEASTDAAAAGSGNGWFGFLEAPIEGLLQLCHSSLVSMGMTANAWGLSILLMTTLIKVLTFPLTKTQLESTNKMQSLQPKIKEIQTMYQSNPDVMNQKIADLYRDNEVNPLAGCLPSFLQIPIFIGLYRAVLTLAKDNALDEPFLFLPSLEGPTYGADPAHGSDWILKGWEAGIPHLGWEQTSAYLVLPVVLVLSQFLSMELMQPQPGPDGTKPESPFILKFLPLMIGWFSLNVPSALGIYWVANNIITTSTTLLIRNQMKTATVAMASSATTLDTTTSSIFAPPPMREKPAGFSTVFESDPDIKPITAIDAEIVDDELGGGMGQEAKKRGKKKKKKRT